jgi:PAS domain S-box-containing protein
VGANHAAARLIGYPRSEVVGKNFQELNLLDDAGVAQARGLLARCGQKQATGPFEYKVRRKDGTWILADIRSYPIEVENQILVLGIIRDITERKQAEETQARLTRQMQLLLESTSEGIYGIDLNGCCTFINPAGARMIGWQPDQVLGRNMHALLHHHRKDGSLYPEEECVFLQAAKTGQVWRGESEVYWRQDGTSFVVECSANPMLENGRITGAVIVFKDITERRQLEEQFRQAQKMEAIGQLAGGVAHDFNNILSATLLHLGLLQQRPQLTPDLKELQEMEKEVGRAAALTRQLLLFSRRQTARFEALDFNDVVKNLLKMLKRLLGENIKINFVSSI